MKRDKDSIATSLNSAKISKPNPRITQAYSEATKKRASSEFCPNEIDEKARFDTKR
jgi:hypothetical protein